MPIDRHFLITSLPAIGELGSAPPMGIADLVEHVAGNKPWRSLVEAIVLLDDLLQREALLSGEIEDADPAILSVQQARGEAPLPDMLVAVDEQDTPAVIEADLLWERYFRYAHELGGSQGALFLVRWVEYEVSLRNALAAARARRLGLEERGYQVALDLVSSTEDLSPVLSEWEAAATPLAGLRVAIRARWSWIDQHDAWFSFSVDELLAYAARIMLLEQWRRSADKEDVAV
ncbi:MAG: hypothetical protein FJ276_11380 [Planctomycetes bacterium]|nr:hypothetical protein [Planctomycetota bacterium]